MFNRSKYSKFWVRDRLIPQESSKLCVEVLWMIFSPRFQGQDVFPEVASKNSKFCNAHMAITFYISKAIHSPEMKKKLSIYVLTCNF